MISNLIRCLKRGSKQFKIQKLTTEVTEKNSFDVILWQLQERKNGGIGKLYDSDRNTNIK